MRRRNLTVQRTLKLLLGSGSAEYGIFTPPELIGLVLYLLFCHVFSNGKAAMVMSLLLGQQQMTPDIAMGGLIAIIFGIVLFFVVISLVVGAVVSYLLYSCFERIPPQHREMESWQVFLLLIPCFSVVWNFFVLPKLARSYQRYFAEQGRTDVGDCGEQIGLWCAICCVACMVPLVGYIASLASFVLFIIYLVKVLTLKGQIPRQ